MDFKKVLIEWKGKKFEGILLPSEGQDDVMLQLKLDSGYNISIPRAEAKVLSEEALELPAMEAPAIDEEDAEVSVLGFGGTISSKVDYTTGAVSPTISAEHLYAEFPEIKNLAKVKVEQKLAIFSEEMSQEHWEMMAEETYSKLKEGLPVVLLHGTDTMSYSAAALSFALRTPLPVILVGAQRSSDRPSSDNKDNLLSAIYGAKQSFGEVAVCMHATTNDGMCYLHRGTKVRKMHSSRRDAFKSINTSPLAKVSWRGFFEFLQEPRKGEGLELRNGFSRDVALVYVTPGIDERIFRPLSQYKGIVLAGTGLGHMPLNKLSNVVSELVKSGVYVYMTTQTLYGAVNMNVYSTGRKQQELGIDGNYNDMLPETAFVKLSWVLAREKDTKRISEMMNTNMAGELSERIVE